MIAATQISVQPPPPEQLKRLLDRRAAAASLSISPRTLDSLVAAGELDPVRIGRRVLFSPIDLDAWVERRRAAAGAQ